MLTGLHNWLSPLQTQGSQIRGALFYSAVAKSGLNPLADVGLKAQMLEKCGSMEQPGKVMMSSSLPFPPVIASNGSTLASAL